MLRLEPSSATSRLLPSSSCRTGERYCRLSPPDATAARPIASEAAGSVPNQCRDSHGADRRAMSRHVIPCQPALAPRVSGAGRAQGGVCRAGAFRSAMADGGGRILFTQTSRQEGRRGCALSGARDLDDVGKVGTVSFAGNYAVASFVHVSHDPQDASSGSLSLEEIKRSLEISRLEEAIDIPEGERLEGPSAQEGEKPTGDLGQILCSMMPAIVVATAFIALAHPPSFTWFQKQHYPLALGGIMLSIGVQLQLSDFVTVLQRPLPVALGVALQYIVKPALGLLTVSLFGVPPQFAAGLVLMACVSGAQLSSYATSLARGSVALSVVLTSLTTMASVFITPFLSQCLIGAVIPVDPIAMAKSIMQVVILPVALGLLLNAKARPLVDRARPYLPLVAIVCTSLCIGSPLAFNRATLVSWQGLALVLPVLAFHAASAAVGYWLVQIPGIRQDEATSRTMALAGAMQSSTLAMLLASQFLGSSHAVPPSCSVVIMSVLGLSLGSFWGKGESLRGRAGKAWGEVKQGAAQGSVDATNEAGRILRLALEMDSTPLQLAARVASFYSQLPFALFLRHTREMLRSTRS